MVAQQRQPGKMLYSISWYKYYEYIACQTTFFKMSDETTRVLREHYILGKNSVRYATPIGESSQQT